MIQNRPKPVLVICPNPAIDILAHLEKFEQGVPNRLIKEERYPGGKGIHVAMALAEYGIEVVVTGFWGGTTGKWIKEECNRYYPSIRFDGPELLEWSRSCYTFKSSDTFDDTEILGTGPTVSAKNVDQLIKIVNGYLPGVSEIAICGSWPKGAPPHATSQILSGAHKVGLRTFLDCTGTQLAEALKASPFCVHLNRKEVTEHFSLDFLAAQKELLNTCEVAAITEGSKGLYLTSAHTSVHRLCKIERVISTIGSGDCLLAGIIAGYATNRPFEIIAKMGAVFGAANCLRPELGMLHKKEVERLLRQAG